MRKSILSRINRINRASVMNQIDNVFIRVLATYFAVILVGMVSALAILAAMKYANQ